MIAANEFALRPFNSPMEAASVVPVSRGPASTQSPPSKEASTGQFEMMLDKKEPKNKGDDDLLRQPEEATDPLERTERRTTQKVVNFSHRQLLNSQQTDGKTDATTDPENPRGAGPKDENQNDAITAATTTTCQGAGEACCAAGLQHVNLNRRTVIFSCCIVLIGVGACSAFIGLGISSAREQDRQQFERRASDLVNGLQVSWDSYEVAGLYVHEACRTGCNRSQFREHYDYIVSTGLQFQVASYNPNVSSQERRRALEAEAKEFYAEYYPNISYHGFMGLEPDPNNSSSLKVQNRSEQPFYFPVHWLEPVVGNEVAIDFDLYSSASRRITIHQALNTWQPALTPRLSLVQETEPGSYGVILMHPGVPLPGVDPDLKPRDFSSIVVRIPDLLRRATKSQLDDKSVYIFDSTDTDQPPTFLGGGSVVVTNGTANYTSHPEVELSDLLKSIGHHISQQNLNIASRDWTVVVLAMPCNSGVETAFIVMGGLIILVSCVCLALWLYNNMRRQNRLNQLKTAAEAEKAALIVAHATQRAKAERELNDFIAHEVRNPLSAAMSACSFVSSAVHSETKPLLDPEVGKSVQEDMRIIESSLQFINDLLRNMLDMQRASSNQLKIDFAPTDIMDDVFVPVDSMLYRRGGEVVVLLDCPKHLVVETDRLRLKQIILNLGRNANKFVEKGFIRLRGEVVDQTVRLYIEDSGPGIPAEKRDNLFKKFQESLDSLNQGTGIGLSLCKRLSELMGASVYLDETYDSGVPGCPGTRFVIDLHRPPIELDDATLNGLGSKHSIQLTVDDISQMSGGTNEFGESLDSLGVDNLVQVPENLSVLFVDDDLILRKLFCRAIKQVAPGWLIKEAASGEAALKLVDGESFDVIFVDQYMTSVDKQLLGTEATRALRSKGVVARICGLSANDCEKAFLEAGADAFLIKPLPTDKRALSRILHSVLYDDDSDQL